MRRYQNKIFFSRKSFMAGKGNIANLRPFSKTNPRNSELIKAGIRRAMENKEIKKKILMDLLCTRLESLLTADQIARLKKEYAIEHRDGGIKMETLYDVWVWKLARLSITPDPRDPSAVLKNILRILTELDITPKNYEKQEQLQISFSSEEKNF
jgi:hypothetical protein